MASDSSVSGVRLASVTTLPRTGQMGVGCLSSNVGALQELYLPLRASLRADLVKNPLAVQETRVNSWVGRSAGEGKGYSLQYSWASLVVQLVKNPPAGTKTDI